MAVKPGHELSERELIDFCRDRLAHFKCPAAVDFGEASEGAAPGTAQAPHAGSADSHSGVERLAAMLGVTEGPAFVVLAGPATAHAGRVTSAGLLPNREEAHMGDKGPGSKSKGKKQKGKKQKPSPA